jgi:hypothetical protein
VFFARFPLCLISALLSLVFFLLVLEITRRNDVSVLTWAVFSFTSPILFFSHLIYPAVSVALLTIFVYRYFVLKDSTNSLSLFLTGIAIGLLPWFGIKFMVLAAILFGVSAFSILSKKKVKNFWRRAYLFLLPIAVSAGFYLLYFWVIYGNIFPVTAYTGVSQGTGPPAYAKRLLLFSFSEVLVRGMGFLIDQKYGLFVYAPIYILGLAGLYFFVKKKRRETALLMVALAGFWIFSANYYWGGYCPPGRPLIPVLWIWGLFLAAALAEKQNGFRKMVTSAGVVLSLAIVWTGLRDPWILYHDRYGSDLRGEFLFSNLTRTLSNSFVEFYDIIPSLRELEAFNWLTLIIWIIVVCGINVLFINKRNSETKRRHPFKITGHLCFVFLVSLLLFTYVFFDIHLENKEVFSEQNYELYFQDDNHFGKEVGGFWTKGERTARVILKSPHPLSSLELTLKSSVGGTTTVQAGSIKKKIKRTKSTGFSKKVAFPPIKGFPMKKGYLTMITIADSSGFVPFQLDRNVKDNRYLGVFVQIKTRITSD